MRKLPSSSPSSTASKSSASCCSKVGLKKGPWTPEEDAILSDYIAREGEGRWRTLPKRAGLMRCGKSCRLRWVNYLRPSVKRGHIAPDEEDLIIRLHRLLGNRWSLIAGRIPGRTDNEIKNYWNTHLSKRLVSQGIDPLTHKPMKSNPNSDDAPSVPKPDPEPNSSSSQEKESDENSADKDWITDPNYDGRAWLLQDVDDVWRNHEGPTIGYGRTLEDDDMGHCDEDVFSSFLNSLANEDAILQMQQQSVRSPLDHLVSSPLSFGCHAFREAAVSSPAATNGDYCRQDANQVDRQL